MTENQKGSLCREHIDSRSSHSRNLVAPDSACIDDQIGITPATRTVIGVHKFDSDHSVTVLDKVCNLVIGKDIRSVHPGIHYVCNGQSERINGSIRYPDGSYQVGVDRRLKKDGFLRVYYICPDASFLAGSNERGLKSKVVLR